MTRDICCHITVIEQLYICYITVILQLYLSYMLYDNRHLLSYDCYITVIYDNRYITVIYVI